MHDDNHIHGVFHSAKKEGLSDFERGSIRETLRLFMSEHPAQAPFFVRATDSVANIFTTYEHAFAARAFSVALVLVLCVGVGSTYAAEGALPGDFLYPLKVNVTESIRGSLALSSEGKAGWHTRQAERRLEEAEELAANGRLTAESAASIVARIESTATDIDTKIALLAQAPEKAAVVADVQSNLEASLTAHERVLEQLSNSLPGVQEAISPILVAVKARAEKAKKARSNAEDIITLANMGDIKSVANAKRRTAEDTLSAVRARAEEAQKLGDVTAKKVTARASLAQQSISEGEEKLNVGEYGGAYGTFQSAIRTARETMTDLDAQVRIMNKTGISLVSNVDAGATATMSLKITTNGETMEISTTTSTSTEIHIEIND